MSDILASDAPGDEGTAPEGTPPTPPAADVDSVDSTEVIPKERFNGLQSKYQSEKSEWEREREAMTTELERLSQAEPENDVSDEVLEELRQLRAERAADKLGAARRDAIDKYPGAAPLADLIVGETPEEIEQMAKELQHRLSGLTPATEGQDDADSTDASNEDSGDDGTPPAPPKAPVVGGGTDFDENATIEDNISAAVASKDFTAFLRATEARSDSRDAELTVG